MQTNKILVFLSFDCCDVLSNISDADIISHICQKLNFGQYLDWKLDIKACFFQLEMFNISQS